MLDQPRNNRSSSLSNLFQLFQLDISLLITNVLHPPIFLLSCALFCVTLKHGLFTVLHFSKDIKTYFYASIFTSLCHILLLVHNALVLIASRGKSYPANTSAKSRTLTQRRQIPMVKNTDKRRVKRLLFCPCIICVFSGREEYQTTYLLRRQ